MTEAELRAKVVETAISYLGCKESDGSHRKIIDLYNSQRPLPVGYKMSYTDPWCAGFVSAVAVQVDLTDIIFPECSCSRMIKLYQKAGRWTENDAYVPQPADLLMYDWQDSGIGDNSGAPDHIGMVTRVDGTTITVIEGNKSDSVAYRTIQVNGRYIRGYCLPDYASKASAAGMGKDWAAEAKSWSINNGLVKGIGTGADGKTEYGWDGNLTLARAVTILYRFAKLIGKA